MLERHRWGGGILLFEEAKFGRLLINRIEIHGSHAHAQRTNLDPMLPQRNRLRRRHRRSDVVYCDNQGAIAIANNPEYHAGTKHIDIQYHFVRNCVEDRSTRLKYCPTAEMVANGLTKGLRPERHRKLGKAMWMSVWKDKKEE